MKKVSKKGFTTIDTNDIFRNTEISYTAKGLFCQMASLPRNWKFSVSGLTKLSPEGRHAVTKAKEELEKHGFLRCNQKKRVNGKFEKMEYILYFEPYKMETDC